MLCNQLFHSMKADIDYILLLYFSLDTEGMWQASTSIIRTTSDISPGNSSTCQVDQAENSQLLIPVAEKWPLWDGENNIIVRESRSPDQSALGAWRQAHRLTWWESRWFLPSWLPLLPSLPQAAALVGRRSQQFRAGLLPDSCFSAYCLGSSTTQLLQHLVILGISNYWGNASQSGAD